MDVLFENAKSALTRLINTLSFVWRTQKPQIQVLGGALLVLIAILAWDNSQWKQPARSDLLSDLHSSQNEQSAADGEFWTSVQAAAFQLSDRQQHQLQQLQQQTTALQLLASNSDWATGMCTLLTPDTVVSLCLILHLLDICVYLQRCEILCDIVCLPGSVNASVKAHFLIPAEWQAIVSDLEVGLKAALAWHVKIERSHAEACFSRVVKSNSA